MKKLRMVIIAKNLRSYKVTEVFIDATTFSANLSRCGNQRNIFHFKL